MARTLGDNTLLTKSEVETLVGGAVSSANNEDVLMRNGSTLMYAQPNLIKRQGRVIGDIFVRDSFANLTGLVDDTGGKTVAIVGDELHMTGDVVSAPSFGAAPTLQLAEYTNLDVLTIECRFSFPNSNSAASSEYGMNIGVYGGAAGYSVAGYMYGAFDANLGFLRIVGGDQYLSTTWKEGIGVDIVPSISVNDIIHYKLELYENTVTWSVRNETDNSDWIVQKYTFTGTQTKHGTGKVSLLVGNADVHVHSLKVSSKQIQNPDVYLYGDSKFTKSTYQNESFVGLLKNHYGQVVGNSGVGDASANLINALPEVIDFVKPKKVLVAISNDIRYGVPSGTWQANMDQIYDDLTAAGIDVYFTSFYETGSSQAAMDTWLAANYSTKYIRTVYTELANNPDVLLGDNIHLSAFGNQIASNAVMIDGRLAPAVIDIPEESTSGTPPDGFGRLRVKADGKIYFENSAGTEYDLTLGGGTNSLLDGSIHSDTAAATVSRGSIIVGKTATPVWDELVLGTTSHVLQSDGTDLVYGLVVDANIGSHTSTKITITAKGQLNSSIVYTDQANSFGDFDQIFKDNRLQINNPADTFKYIITAGAIGADRVLNLPVITATDTIATLGLAQTFTAANTFNDNTLKLRNPGDTFSYTLRSSAIAANRDITWPLLTGNDVVVTEAHSQTLSNKTLGITNIITLREDRFTLQDDADNTKQLAFQLAAISTGTTRTISIPNASGTMALVDLANTWGTVNQNINSTGKWQEGGVAISPIGKHDIDIPATAMWSTTTAGCALIAKTELATNKINFYSLDFDTGTEENAQFAVRLPRNWNAGTITAFFYWTAASGSGTVAWGIKGVARSDDDALDAAFGTEVTTTDTLLAANDLHISPESTAITIGGTPVAGDCVHFNVARKVASDTLGVDAKLLRVVLVITTNAAVAA